MSSKRTESNSRIPRKPNGETEGKKDSMGIRYITEDLICRFSKQNNVEQVTNLNLKLNVEGSKKFKYIENLEKCKRLQVLNLSCNQIEKLEKLDKLTKLRELDISYNCLTKIEGLETLTCLTHLNLTGNKISTVPAWLPKKLKALRVFKLARNEILSLHELTKLRPLRDLTHLTIAENPVTKLPHCRLFLVFHLRTLDTVDAQQVDWQERTEAQARFAQEELEHLQKQLDAKNAEMQKLEESHNKSLGEIEEGVKTTASQKEKLKAMNEKIKELHQVLQTKDDLLTRKTRELTKACEKHYELEQELAFYKIDHKFEQLGKPPTPLGVNLSQGDVGDSGLIGESPYIGRGRFHKQKMLNETSANQQGMSHDNRSRDGSYIDDETRLQMHEALDRELEDKKKSIARAQDRLHHLSKEVTNVEEQLALASRELKRLQDTQPRPHLTEDDKHVVRSKLAKKISKVHHLRSEADRLGDEMQSAQDHIQKQERNISQIRNQLRRMGSQHQLYPQFQREVADEESQLELTNQQYQDLVAKLEDVLATIAKETTDIQQLEHQLREGQITQNEEMKDELEGIILGLQTYLQEVQQKSAEQKEDFSVLLGEREELQRQIEDLMDENDQLRVTRDHLSQLQDRMASLEESLEDAQEENRSLHQQLNESRIREMEDAEMSIHLRDAEQEILRLQKAVEEADRKIQAERAAAEAKIEKERLQIRQLAGRARDASDAEDELHNLQQQLAELQAANSELQDQLYKTQQSKEKEGQKLIDPADLKRRLDNFRKVVRSGQRAEKAHHKDPVGQALVDLQNDLEGQLEKSYHDLEQAHETAAKAQKEMALYKRQLQEKEAQLSEERRRHEQVERTKQDANQRVSKREKSAQIDLEREEMERLRRELERMRAELERGKDRGSKDVPIPTRLLEPSRRSQTSITSTYRPSQVLSIESSSEATSERETGSLRSGSSEWSKRRHQLYEGMTPDEQDLFDELQAEIEELRKLLAMKKNKQAMDKMTQAEMTANKLLGLMGDRHRRHTETEDGSGRRHSSAKHMQGDQRKSSSSKRYQDPRLEKTAIELEHAQNEIEDLRMKLKEKRAQLKHEVKHSDKVQDVIDGQQEEIDRLHLILDEQRSEIEKLRNKMDHLTRRPHDTTMDHITAYDAELQELQDSAATLRDTLASHVPRIQRLGDFRGFGQGRDEPDIGRPYYHQTDYGNQNHWTEPAGHLYRGVPSTTLQDGRPVPPPTFGHSDQPSHAHPVAKQVPTHAHLTFGAPLNAQNQTNIPSGFIPTNNIPVTSYGLPGGASVFQPPGGYNSNQNGPAQPEYIVVQGQGQANTVTPGVVFQASPQHAVIPQLPTTPLKHIMSHSQHIMSHSQPTTPIAGSVLGPSVLSMTTTPSQATSIPVMVSTPLQDGNTSLKGILKNSNREDDAEEQLVCNVPEHHDLEDYITKLQSKIKSLKTKLKTKQATKEKKGDGHRVVFEDDVERSAIKHLHAELQARRGELEGLDLAIERQKSSLRKMKETEKFLLSEREAAKKELKNLKKNRTREEHRKSFLEGHGNYDIYDSDYDYDYVPSKQPFKGARVTYLQEEIACLEKTLASRRAELREADRLLEECQDEVELTKAQTKSTLEKYQEAKTNFHQTLKDAELLESHARETGQELVRARTQVSDLMKEVAALQILRQENQDMLKAIEEVISSRDKEFQVIDKKLKEARAALDEQQKNFVPKSSSKETHQVAADGDVHTHHQEELAEVQETLRRRQGQLDSLERQLDRELARGKREVDELVSRSELLKAEQEQFEKLMETKQEQLEQEESALKKTRLEKLHAVRDLEEMKVKVADAKDDLEGLENQRQILEGTLETLRQDKTTLEDLNKAVEKKISQLQRSETKLSNNVKEAENTLNRLENNIKEAECDIEGLQNERSSTHSELLSMKTELQERKTELEMVVNEINEAENQLALIQQRETERRQLTDEKIANLELRVQEMGREIKKRTEEKEKLVDALSRSSEELQSLRHNLSKERDELQQKIRDMQGDIEVLKTQLEDRSKEVQQVREKSSQEIADLENIAQAHYSRANRLSDELNYLQAEYLELREKLKSQQEVDEKEKFLEEAIEQMRADIKQELAGSLGEMELSHLESLSELQHMQGRSDYLQECLRQLRQSLKMINMKNTQTTAENSIQGTSQGVEEEFAKQQNFLMAQLREKVNKHADHFASQKQLSQESIQNLQLKLSNLEKTFAQNEASMRLSESQFVQKSSHSLDEDLQNAVILPTSAEESYLLKRRSPSPKRAYSPNRHSRTRQRNYSGSEIPERDNSR